MVERVIESPPSSYDLITGNSGTGKSTLVCRLARRLPGVVYVTIPLAVPTGSASALPCLVRALEAALNLGPTCTWSREIFNKVITTRESGQYRQPFCFVYVLIYFVKRATNLITHTSFGWRISGEPLRASKQSTRPGQ